ncbi:DUF3493 domain-containing protein [Umezakia ovalisporum]|jgi:uncharacterized membrane protein YjgN (DUF898 family)|uniref:DUF3493 domain-containing protein n=2 Tax=Umezakia ovalisporum TaxID=75695 RepID=A0AA43GZK9_9CYAN|nr:DUF3493 domain-containing protein [Umezakia ovalisporum]MBI1240022.1 DUF3493 domain-containing protein [Nostoc sp. RI_552]MDH6056933.1 DUF3493 domain-containing protein [Umezakia ovalisporum FSS-43]MDH6064501.1 DUF3493 domain-containing protein [Umezakia ovalisporum FSS-62]MDH6068383.1 DUF3493 domain-containing protein [Umezakia ovalisporum APH033B]MDH6071124.1 DUF3493 domain-containing protein [Umezakia ovalisporum CobakiLakeA]
MAKPNPQTRLNPEQYARLKAEMATPYRGVRQFIYIGFGASALIGAFIFFFQVLAGEDVNSTVPNLALQLGILAVIIFLWKKDKNRQTRS